MAKCSNEHRIYKWAESSKPLLSQYIALVGKAKNKTININDFKFSSTNASVQIQACRIVGYTLFTRLRGGRGEGKDKNHPERFR